LVSFKAELTSVFVMALVCFVSVLCLTFFACFKLEQIAQAHSARIEMIPFIKIPIVPMPSTSYKSATIEIGIDQQHVTKKKKFFLPL
jgi:hypothetical protein